MAVFPQKVFPEHVRKSDTIVSPDPEWNKSFLGTFVFCVTMTTTITTKPTFLLQFLQSISCFLDEHVVTIYAILVVSALTSQIGPLRRLTQHGKSRQPLASSSSTSSSTQHSGNKNVNIYAGLWEWICQGDAWMVQKQKFLHFYIWGTIVLVTVLTCAPPPVSVDPFSSPTVAQGLLLFHLIRRWYECIHVHEWRSSSCMHLLVYILGLLYYTLLPFIVCRVSNCQSTTTSSSSTRENISSEADSTDPDGHVLFRQVAATILCFYGQYQQARHHVLLAKLRTTTDNDDMANDKRSKKSIYRLPQGGWFAHVACPHYLAEVLFYVGLAALVDSLARGAVIVAWVATTLTINALQAQEWYQRNIPNYAQLQRCAIFPFLL